MGTASAVLAGFVGVLHIWFLVLEMFLWTTPFAVKRLGRTIEELEATKVLASNQGLYNGFIAAGLFWSLGAPAGFAIPLRVFFLGCVTVAGVYGALTASKQILFLQALPGLIALVVTLAAR